MQNRANLATAKLPEEVRRTGLTIAKVSTDLLQVFLFYSPDGDKDGLFLSNFVTLNVLDEIKRVPGVGDASIFGARDYSMRIWIDPGKLANFDLSTQDVITAVQTQNVQAAAGRIGAAPLSPDQRLQLTVTTKGHLGRGVREHHRARHGRRLVRARARRGARRARSGNVRQRGAVRG